MTAAPGHCPALPQQQRAAAVPDQTGAALQQLTPQPAGQAQHISFSGNNQRPPFASPLGVTAVCARGVRFVLIASS